jgi:hypothetical protein
LIDQIQSFSLVESLVLEEGIICYSRMYSMLIGILVTIIGNTYEEKDLEIIGIVLAILSGFSFFIQHLILRSISFGIIDSYQINKSHQGLHLLDSPKNENLFLQIIVHKFA